VSVEKFPGGETNGKKSKNSKKGPKIASTIKPLPGGRANGKKTEK